MGTSVEVSVWTVLQANAEQVTVTAPSESNRPMDLGSKEQQPRSAINSRGEVP